MSTSLEAAKKALVDDGGCSPERAALITEALGAVGAEEALNVAGGTQDVFGSVVDTRVDRLRRLLERIPQAEPPLTRYEVGVLFRIKPSQAHSLNGTYQARYPAKYRERLDKSVKSAARKADKVGLLKAKDFEFAFDNLVVLDYAVDRLRRQGFERGLSVDRAKLTVTVSRTDKDSGKRSAAEFLKGDEPKT